jgi:hypothetical protein
MPAPAAAPVPCPRWNAGDDKASAQGEGKMTDALGNAISALVDGSRSRLIALVVPRAGVYLAPFNKQDVEHVACVPRSQCRQTSTHWLMFLRSSTG